MSNPHRRAVQRALFAVDYLGTLFDRIGNGDNPDGDILIAYRAALAGLDGALDNPSRVRAILDQQWWAIRTSVLDVLSDAADYAISQAEEDLADWGIGRAGFTVAADYLSNVVKAALGPLDQQINSVYADVYGGSPDRNELLGDESRAGILSPVALILPVARWIVTVHANTYNDTVARGVQQAGKQADEYGKQAVAVIDERTTDCCLKVHGQIVAMGGMFHLAGTPRFADDIDAPPFHWNCRTALALVDLNRQDNNFTNKMREAADAEITARQDGSREEIHPANAFSRRG